MFKHLLPAVHANDAWHLHVLVARCSEEVWLHTYVPNFFNEGDVIIDVFLDPVSFADICFAPEDVAKVVVQEVHISKRVGEITLDELEGMAGVQAVTRSDDHQGAPTLQKFQGFDCTFVSRDGFVVLRNYEFMASSQPFGGVPGQDFTAVVVRVPLFPVRLPVPQRVVGVDT